MIRSSLAGLSLVAVLASPALAQNECAASATAVHTQDAVIYDPVTKHVLEVVCPTNDAELNDPAFRPVGASRVLVSHAPSVDPIQTAIGANALLGLQGPKQLQAAAAAALSTSLAQCASSSVCSASLAATGTP